MFSNDVFAVVSRMAPQLSTQDVNGVLDYVGSLGLNTTEYSEDFIIKCAAIVATGTLGIREAENGDTGFMDAVAEHLCK